MTRTAGAEKGREKWRADSGISHRPSSQVPPRCEFTVPPGGEEFLQGLRFILQVRHLRLGQEKKALYKSLRRI